MDVEELSINTDGIELPKKITRRGEAGIKTENVFLSGTLLDSEGFPSEIFGYRFETKGTYMRAGTETEPRDLSQGPRSDVSMHARHKFLFKVFRFFIKRNKEHFDRGGNVTQDYLYDAGSAIYSKHKVDDLSLVLDEDQISEANLLDSDDLKGFIGNVKHLYLTFQYTHCINVKQAFAKQEPELLRILDILSEQHTRARNNTHIYNNKMFYIKPKEGHDNVVDGVICKLGAEKSFSYAVNAQGETVPFVNYYPKSALFYPEKLVTDFIRDMFPRSYDGRFRIENDLGIISKHLKGVSVVTTHLPKNRMFAIHGLTKYPASRTTFKKEDQEISVADYFHDCYKTRLSHPELPCAIHKRARSGDCYYPLECLRILPGQHLSLEKQTQCKLTEKLLRASLKNPTFFVQDVETARTDASISANPYFKHYGTLLIDQVTERPATVLCPPSIAYGNYQCNPNEQGLFGDTPNVEWRMGRNIFLKPADVPKWGVIIMCRSLQRNQAEMFVQNLISSGRNRGMNFPRENPEIFTLDIYNLRDTRSAFKTCADRGCRFLMFLSKGNDVREKHGHIKFVENESKIVSQHIGNGQMIERLAQNPRGVALDNLLMKMNLKLGGINYSVRPADILARRRLTVHDVLKDQSLKGRMFIGLDLSHSGPQTTYERVTGAAVTQPTVVGMSYTLDSPANMRGTYWMQTAREVVIQKLSDEICEAIQVNINANGGRPPFHLIVYRNGVSEGEYKKIVAVEQASIVNAIDKLKQKSLIRNEIKITIVVVQRNAKLRMVPAKIGKTNNKQANSKSTNVQAGTLIDGDLMNPAYTEFLLNSHTGIQLIQNFQFFSTNDINLKGTSRPVRYTVICDTGSNRMDLTELENVTNAMCYLHGIVTSPVSVPAPLYSAEDLAKRGRNNWKTLSDDSRLCGGDPGLLSNYAEKPSARIDSRFWA